MRIKATDTEKLTAAIKEAEGRATARTVTAKDICAKLAKVGADIAKSKLDGTKVHYTGAEHFANAYQYRPVSTHWTAENKRGVWYITDITRRTCPSRSTWDTAIEYSDTAKAAIIDKLSHI